MTIEHPFIGLFLSCLMAMMLFFLFSPEAFAVTNLQSYWPLNHGDSKIFKYGTNTLTMSVKNYINDQYIVNAETSTGSSGYEVHQISGDKIQVVSGKEGWITISFSPAIDLLSESVLSNGGTLTTRTTVTQRYAGSYPATFTVTVKMAGTVTVPAGTFYNCRSVSVGEVATIPDQGKVSVNYLTAILAPGVGVIKRIVDPGTGAWAELVSGTVGGQDVAQIPLTPAITTMSPLPSAMVGAIYNQSLAASDGATPYAWSISSGSLPAGLSLSSAGVISGTPVSETTASFTVQVTGGNGLFTEKTFTLEVLESSSASQTTDQTNVPLWTGAWTNIIPVNQVCQSFIPARSPLTGVDVAILSVNGGGDDQITMKIIDDQGQILASVKQKVHDGYDGMLHFSIPGEGLSVDTNRKYIIQLEDTGKIVFGWKYGSDTYKSGSMLFYGSEKYNDFLFITYSTISDPESLDGGHDVTSGLWAKAVLQVPGAPVTLKWKLVGADITPSGDQVISGYFYADPNDFAYGSAYNPEVFVKIYIATSGWCNIAFNHVTVDNVTVYSAHQYTGAAQQTGTMTLANRLVEHQYNGVAIQNIPQANGVLAPSNTDGGYTITSGLWGKAVLQPAAGPVTLIWKEVGSDTTPSGDKVVSGYFYADPGDFAYGSEFNPEAFVKVYIAKSGWCNIAFNHVTVDNVSICSAYNYAGNANQSGTASLSNRLVENPYDGVNIVGENIDYFPLKVGYSWRLLPRTGIRVTGSIPLSAKKLFAAWKSIVGTVRKPLMTIIE